MNVNSWKEIEQGISIIMNDLQGGFPNDLYMNLYTTIYNECSV